MITPCDRYGLVGMLLVLSPVLDGYLIVTR
jgi:hypothetical protein